MRANQIQEQFWGYTQTAWTGVGAIGALVSAALTLGTLVFIALQVAQARNAYVEGVVERASDRFAVMRTNVLRLRIASGLKRSFSEPEMQSLHSVAISYAHFSDTVKFIFKNRRSSSLAIIDSYVDDISSINDVIRHVRDDLLGRVGVYKEQAWSFQLRTLTALSASAEDIAACKAAFDARDYDKQRKLVDIIFSKEAAARGISADEMVKLAEERASAKSDREITKAEYEKAGFDYENLAMVELWFATLDQCFNYLEKCTNTLKAFMSDYMKNPIRQWVASHANS